MGPLYKQQTIMEDLLITNLITIKPKSLSLSNLLRRRYGPGTNSSTNLLLSSHDYVMTRYPTLQIIHISKLNPISSLNNKEGSRQRLIHIYYSFVINYVSGNKGFCWWKTIVLDVNLILLFE